MKLPNTSITRHVFQRDIDLSMTNKNNWCSNFKQMLVRLSLYDESLWKTNCYDLNEIKSKLFRLMETTWLIDMHNKPKLLRYITFKTTLIVSSHVKQYISKPRRSLLIQLITGILPIALETGRYKRIRDPVTKTFRSLRVEERLCNMCDLSETEDEMHFLFICFLYDTFRTTLFQTVTENNHKFLELNNADKFLFLVIHFWKPLSKFVEAAWNYSDYELLVLF